MTHSIGRRPIINFWDQKWNTPIARHAAIASWPSIPFNHSSIKTEDVCLVSGYSFSGASGSPVIAHEKSIKPGNGLRNPNYVPSKVIGIMSGHYWDDHGEENESQHSGMSYFTRSTAIWDIITKNKLG